MELWTFLQVITRNAEIYSRKYKHSTHCIQCISKIHRPESRCICSRDFASSNIIKLWRNHYPRKSCMAFKRSPIHRKQGKGTQYSCYLYQLSITSYLWNRNRQHMRNTYINGLFNKRKECAKYCIYWRT